MLGETSSRNGVACGLQDVRVSAGLGLCNDGDASGLHAHGPTKAEQNKIKYKKAEGNARLYCVPATPRVSVPITLHSRQSGGRCSVAPMVLVISAFGVKAFFSEAADVVWALPGSDRSIDSSVHR